MCCVLFVLLVWMLIIISLGNNYIYMYCLLTYSRHELDNIEERNCVLRTFWRSTIRIWPWSMESLAPRTKGNHDRPQGWVQSMLFNIYRYITLASSTTYILYISFIYIYIYYIYRYRSIYIDLLHHLICCRKRMDNGRWTLMPRCPSQLSCSETMVKIHVNVTKHMIDGKYIYIIPCTELIRSWKCICAGTLRLKHQRQGWPNLLRLRRKPLSTTHMLAAWCSYLSFTTASLARQHKHHKIL